MYIPDYNSYFDLSGLLDLVCVCLSVQLVIKCSLFIAYKQAREAVRYSYSLSFATVQYQLAWDKTENFCDSEL